MPKYLKDLTSLNNESQIDANLEFVSVLGDGNEKLIPRDLLVSYLSGAISPLDKLSFDTTPTGSLTATGDVIWNDAEETVDVQLHGFVMHVGQHMVYRVKNNTASTIGRGVPVMFAGTSGASGKLHVTPWNPASPVTRFMGLTTEELSVGEEGFVIAFGKLRNIQTDGDNYGETWANGDIIYASPDTIGYLTNVQPTAPDPIIEVMAVVHAAANNGNVFVRPTYAQGPQGTPGQDALWNFTGAYGAGTAYAVGDVATYDGETWYRIDAHGGTVGDTPAEGAFWTKLAAKGASGGSNYLPLAGGTMDANASIIWDNASAIREAGAQGLEIECSVGYRWQWVAGRMILRQINSGQIQRVLAIDGVTPGNTEDISEGFIVGTRWETQDGTIYECTDSTDGAAVWANVSPVITNTDATLDDLTITSLRGAAGVKAQLQFPEVSGVGVNRFIGTGTGVNGLNMTELHDGSGNRMGIIYCPPTNNAAGVTPDMTITNERNGSLKLGVNGNDRFVLFSNGGAYIGNDDPYVAGTNPGAYNLKVKGTIEAETGLIYTPATLANWDSSADPGMVDDALDQLAGRTKVLEGAISGAETYIINDPAGFTTSSSTSANVPGFACTIAENEELTIEVFGFHQASSGGVKVNFSGPSSPTYVRYVFAHWTSATSIRTSNTGAATAFNTDILESGGTPLSLPFSVLLTAKAGDFGGTIQFKIASVTTGQNTILNAGTIMRVTR